MSLCPLSTRKLRQYGRMFGKDFIHGSAHHNHSLVLVDWRGDVWESDERRTALTRVAYDTTTSARIKVERQT